MATESAKEFMRWLDDAEVFEGKSLEPEHTSSRFGEIGSGILSVISFLDRLLLVPLSPQRKVVLALGTLNGANVSGVGLDCTSALMAVAGETAELVALRRGAESSGSAERVTELLDRLSPRSSDEWSDVLSIDGGTSTVPADLLRLGEGVMTPASEGCSAWTSPDGAKAGALLELIERDAMTLWWAGGRPGTILEHDGPKDLWRYAPGGVERSVYVIDVSVDASLPVVCAVSFRKDGRGFASGAAAGLTLAEALQSALRELCQIELGQLLLELQIWLDGRQSIGEAGADELQRAEVLDEREFRSEAFRSDPPRRMKLARGPSRDLATLVQRLTALDLRAYLADLGTVGSMYVAKALSPDLQSSNPQLPSARLRALGAPFEFTKNLRLY